MESPWLTLAEHQLWSMDGSEQATCTFSAPSACKGLAVRRRDAWQTEQHIARVQRQVTRKAWRRGTSSPMALVALGPDCPPQSVSSW